MQIGAGKSVMDRMRELTLPPAENAPKFTLGPSPSFTEPLRFVPSLSDPRRDSDPRPDCDPRCDPLILARCDNLCEYSSWPEGSATSSTVGDEHIPLLPLPIFRCGGRRGSWRWQRSPRERVSSVLCHRRSANSSPSGLRVGWTGRVWRPMWCSSFRACRWF